MKHDREPAPFPRYAPEEMPAARAETQAALEHPSSIMVPPTRKSFVVLDSQVVNSTYLSDAAFRALAWCLDKSAHLAVYSAEATFGAAFGWGKDKCNRVIRELEQATHAFKTVTTSADGQESVWFWKFSEMPSGVEPPTGPGGKPKAWSLDSRRCPQFVTHGAGALPMAGIKPPGARRAKGEPTIWTRSYFAGKPVDFSLLKTSKVAGGKTRPKINANAYERGDIVVNSDITIPLPLPVEGEKNSDFSQTSDSADSKASGKRTAGRQATKRPRRKRAGRGCRLPVRSLSPQRSRKPQTGVGCKHGIAEIQATGFTADTEPVTRLLANPLTEIPQAIYRQANAPAVGSHLWLEHIRQNPFNGLAQRVLETEVWDVDTTRQFTERMARGSIAPNEVLLAHLASSINSDAAQDAVRGLRAQWSAKCIHRGPVYTDTGFQGTPEDGMYRVEFDYLQAVDMCRRAVAVPFIEHLEKFAERQFRDMPDAGLFFDMARNDLPRAERLDAPRLARQWYGKERNRRWLESLAENNRELAWWWVNAVYRHSCPITRSLIKGHRDLAFFLNPLVGEQIVRRMFAGITVPLGVDLLEFLAGALLSHKRWAHCSDLLDVVRQVAGTPPRVLANLFAPSTAAGFDHKLMIEARNPDSRFAAMRIMALESEWRAGGSRQMALDAAKRKAREDKAFWRNKNQSKRCVA